MLIVQLTQVHDIYRRTVRSLVPTFSTENIVILTTCSILQQAAEFILHIVGQFVTHLSRLSVSAFFWIPVLINILHLIYMRGWSAVYA